MGREDSRDWVMVSAWWQGGWVCFGASKVVLLRAQKHSALGRVGREMRAEDGLAGESWQQEAAKKSVLWLRFHAHPRERIGKG